MQCGFIVFYLKLLRTKHDNKSRGKTTSVNLSTNVTLQFIITLNLIWKFAEMLSESIGVPRNQDYR